MAKFGKRSKERLYTCADDIVRVMEISIQIFDFKVLEGKRNKYLQNLYFSQDKSTIQWPNGKHNVPIEDITLPREDWDEDPDGKSKAIDIAPWPIDWSDYNRFILLAGVVMGVAAREGIPWRWGGWWQGDLSKYKKGGQNFNDLPHHELM